MTVAPLEPLAATWFLQNENQNILCEPCEGEGKKIRADYVLKATYQRLHPSEITDDSWRLRECRIYRCKRHATKVHARHTENLKAKGQTVDDSE